MGAPREHGRSAVSKRPWTLCFDVGGTNVKANVIAADGVEVGQASVTPTPRPAVPSALLAAMEGVAQGREYDRIAVGFPGVVRDGVTETAPNLDGGWRGFRLGAEVAARLGAETRVANDADLHGLGLIEGKGVEMVFTLGTGLGSAVYIDGKLVPNLELGHHPFGDGQTYEERVGAAVIAAVGEDTWRKRVRETIDQVRPIWNFRHLYIGGGNARLLTPADVAVDCSLIDYQAGIRGAAKLFDG